jgi:hypothetical protein
MVVGLLARCASGRLGVGGKSDHVVGPWGLTFAGDGIVGALPVAVFGSRLVRRRGVDRRRGRRRR